MENKLDALHEVLLMGPGPSCVPDEVYTALAKPTIGHLDPQFIEIMDEIKVMLQTVMQTQNDLSIPMSGTGSAGMETCFVNLIEPGDEVLILINGVFGKRMEDVASRLGARVDAMEFEWGKPVEPEAVRAQLSKKDYMMAAMVHAETSTGVCNPAAAVAECLKDHNALFLLDTVTSLGGIPVETDAWGVDALYSGTQKCLSCPPGLSPVSLSSKAVEKLKARKTKVPNWYLDLTMIANYWGGGTRAYHHTAPINMLYGIYQALFNVLEEGLDNVYQRHREMHKALVSGLEGLGLEMLVEADYRLPMLNTVKTPDGIDEALVRKRLLQEHQIEIGSGLGPLAGKVWRIGLMGHTARLANVERFLAALKSVL